MTPVGSCLGDLVRPLEISFDASVTFGPLKTTAELTVLQWDPTTRLFVSWQIVQIGTDGTATVTDPAPWPSIAPEEPAPEPTDGS